MTFKRIFQATYPQLGLLLLSLILLSACSLASAQNQTDEAAIYSTVIRRIYTQDDTFGGMFQAPTIFILQHTDDTTGDPDSERTDSKFIPAAVQDAIADALVDLPTQVIWIADPADVTLDQETGAVADGGAIVTLGNIHIQDDGSVLVSGSIYVAFLAGGGQTYIVEQISGIWEVTGNTGLVWME